MRAPLMRAHSSVSLFLFCGMSQRTRVRARVRALSHPHGSDSGALSYLLLVRCCVHSHEAPITGGFGAEVAAAVQEKVCPCTRPARR